MHMRAKLLAFQVSCPGLSNAEVNALLFMGYGAPAPNRHVVAFEHGDSAARDSMQHRLALLAEFPRIDLEGEHDPLLSLVVIEVNACSFAKGNPALLNLDGAVEALQRDLAGVRNAKARKV